MRRPRRAGTRPPGAERTRSRFWRPSPSAAFLVAAGYGAVVVLGMSFGLAVSLSGPDPLKQPSTVATGAPAAVPPARAEFLATYRVLGPSKRARVTYTDASGDHNELVVDLPWEKSSPVVRGDRVALTVDNLTNADVVAEIHLTPYSDHAARDVIVGAAATGRPWRRAQGGEFATFACEGRVGDVSEVPAGTGVGGTSPFVPPSGSRPTPTTSVGLGRRVGRAECGEIWGAGGEPPAARLASAWSRDVCRRRPQIESAQEA